jgi:hypothetical protein
LAFCFEVGFGNEVDDGAVFGEYFSEGNFELVRFDALFEVFDVDAGVRDKLALRHSMGQEEDTHTLRSGGSAWLWIDRQMTTEALKLKKSALCNASLPGS